MPRSVRIPGWLRVCVLPCVLVGACTSPARAGEAYAVVVTGASGGELYAEKYDRWRDTFVATLHDALGYKEDRLFILAERERPGTLAATREHVQRVFGELRATLTPDDQLLVLLIGHGTAMDSEDGKFNLVGPDLTASEWAAMVTPIAGRLIFVDTTGASFPFLHKLAGRNRIVVTATDAAAQQFETTFAEFFVKAFADTAADEDKNGRVSVWEAFSYASAGVRQWFDQQGQLPTERPVLDDTGSGVGREARNPGADGGVARVTYLDAGHDPAGSSDSPQAALLMQRKTLERELDDLKARKGDTPSAEYDAALEKLLLDIATVSRRIRGQ